MAGFSSFYVCTPKAWATRNLDRSKYVDITLLSDGSLRIAPEVEE